MLPDRPWLIFDLDDARFGVEATLVRETVWLPELTPVEEAPPYIVGIFSLRDQFIPVIDLTLRFGHPARPYKLSDQVVVLEQDQALMGLIVSEVQEVVDFPDNAIQPVPEYKLEPHHNANLITGEAQLGEDIVSLLDLSQLASISQNLAQDAVTDHPALRFCPDATPEERAIFHARAKVLLEPIDDTEGRHLALAVVEMEGEYFGIELESVQEFSEATRFSAIPCCPQHILGAMSLRGTLLTLLDVRTALNLPPAKKSSGKVVVARIGEQAVGVYVDDVHDVVYLQQSEMQAAPAMLREQRGAEIKGAAHYGGKIMAILDLPALLARDEWIVNDT